MSDVPEKKKVRPGGTLDKIRKLREQQWIRGETAFWPAVCLECEGNGLPPITMRYWLEPDAKCFYCDGRGTIVV